MSQNYAGPPYPGAPGAPAQPYPAAPGQPYAQPPYGYGVPQPPAKKTGLIVLVGLVVVLIIVCVVILATRGGGGGGGGIFAPRPEPEVPVQGYLDALAAGNASEALSFAAQTPNDTFLNNTVLSASLAINSITGIEVHEANTDAGAPYTVSADYRIGSEAISTTFTVVQVEDRLLLQQVAQDVSLGSIYAPGAGLTINGVAAGYGATTVTLFPGTYQLAVTNSYLEITNEQFVVRDVSGATAISAELGMASGAKAKLAKAAKSELSKCMKQKKMQTTCGFGFTAGKNQHPRLSTLKWSFLSGKDAISNAKWTYGQMSPTAASAKVKIKLKVWVNGPGRVYYQGKISITGVTVDFADPEEPDVSFDWGYA